jgi:hypothetical protein
MVVGGTNGFNTYAALIVRGAEKGVKNRTLMAD